MLVNVIRPIPPVCIAFIKAREKLELVAYPDPGSGGAPWTVGWGSTRGVRPGMTITLEEAESRLRSDLEHAAEALEAKIGETCLHELTEHQYAALISFVFNLGTGDPKKKEWDIWAILRAQKFDAVPSEMVRFRTSGGRVMQGLINRRADEIKLWSTAEPGSVPDDPPSSVTRTVDTPPTPVAVKPLSKSKSWWVGIVSAGLTSASAVAPQVKQGVDGATAAIEPYVGKSEVLQAISSHLALVAAAAALAVPALLWLKNHEAKSL